MSYAVRLTETARRDFARLVLFLADDSRVAAERASLLLEDAILSLGDMPHRGRPLSGARRELFVAFGQYGYVIRYRVKTTEVMVSRIWHSKERR